jgi:prepilin peptidase CpaA
LNLETWAPIAALTGLCAAAAWLDLTQRRIPNWLCGLTLVAGLALATATGGFTGLGSHALHAALALLGGMALFALGGLGGGDAKFYAAAASWFGLGQATLLLVYVALSGLALLIVWFVYRRARRIPIRQKSKDPMDSLPYGIAIAAGTIAAVLI